jgi:predicted nucleic acid-binding protein
VGVILDTAVLVAAERGTFDMPGYLVALEDEPVALAAISASELLRGVERARDPAV